MAKLPFILGRALLVATLALVAAPTSAHPITAALEGCVVVTDARLAEALWTATGTFQAVAFDDPFAGCDTTIAHPVQDAFLFDENRFDNTLKAWLDLSKLPSCGRRQYDLHHYLGYDVLDPDGLKSLVIDTGVDCITFSQEPPDNHVPEPSSFALVACGFVAVFWLRARG
jgi:hypothetical protein